MRRSWIVNTLKRQDTEIQNELYAKFFHGLSNPTRFRIVEILLDGEKTVSDLVYMLSVTQGQVSNHLACLKWCGYVSSRQDGKYVIYRITDERVRVIMQLAKEMVSDNAAHISQCTRM
ncbi:ArsR family transcriptional regulator [Ferroacidibacillus organovorans]|uniref:ArsR family transcriptional regulator n=1 Tax=Ferroacidibacillus organovorans TaxID=1765683 RepID=A0A117SX19_9BACL|nr:ArsR family transcriptional regulator [Ferroacidibacillus organovorans]